MPHGKPAGVPCVQLTADLRCALFGRPERPAVCASLRPMPDMCGADAAEARALLAALELATQTDLVALVRDAAAVHGLRADAH